VAVRCKEIVVVEEEGKWRAGLKKLGQAKGDVEQAAAVVAVHREKRNGDPDIRICTGCPFLVHWAPGN
jgi:hypothetical protein